MNDHIGMLMDSSSSEWWTVTSSALSAVIAGLVLIAVSAYRVARRSREKVVDDRFVKLEKRVENTRDKHGCEINDTRRYVDILYQEFKHELPEYPKRD